jgi:hypothetical protein
MTVMAISVHEEMNGLMPGVRRQSRGGCRLSLAISRAGTSTLQRGFHQTEPIASLSQTDPALRDLVTELLGLGLSRHSLNVRRIRIQKMRSGSLMRGRLILRFRTARRWRVRRDACRSPRRAVAVDIRAAFSGGAGQSTPRATNSATSASWAACSAAVRLGSRFTVSKGVASRS